MPRNRVRVRRSSTGRRASLFVASFLALALGIAVSALAQAFEIKLIALTSPVSPGDDVTLVAQTAPGALCLITVRYKSGPSKARGLVPKTADTRGLVTWT